MKKYRREMRHTANPLDLRLFKGGSSDSSGSPVTTNTDRRQALSDSVSVGDGAYVMGGISRNNYDYTSYADNRKFDNSFKSADSWSATDSRSFTDSRTSTDNSVTYSADAQVLQTLAETMPDAVKALASAGADVINRAGGAVVDLNRDSIAANTRSFDHVVNFGSQAIDKIIDASIKTSAAGNQLAAQAVASYQPAEKNNADTLKYGMYAAAALVAVVILNKGTK